MDKKEIYQKAGYVFSGAYSGDKSEMKLRQKQFHKEGYKAVIITVKSLARYTTGSGGKIYHVGYSIYIKPKKEVTK